MPRHKALPETWGHPSSLAGQGQRGAGVTWGWGRLPLVALFRPEGRASGLQGGERFGSFGGYLESLVVGFLLFFFFFKETIAFFAILY